MYLEWDNSLSVGVESIDDQHKELVNRTNQLFEAMKSGKGKGEVMNTLSFLEEYVVTHFNDEEEYMKKIKHEGLAIQREQHEAFKKEIIEIKKKCEETGISLPIVIDTQKKVSSWIRNHILVYDKQIGK